MSYQINIDDENKLVFDGEYVHCSIPVTPIPRGSTTYALVRHFWKMCEFAHFVVHVLNDHVNRPLEIAVIPKKFEPNYSPKNFLTDFEVKTSSVFGMSADRIIFDEFG